MPQERGVVIRVHTELAEALPQAVGAENEIRDALTNTVLNAVDAMPEGGTLCLRTRLIPEAGQEPGTSAAPRVCVEIGDTGIGMSEEVRSRCIEPFFTTKGERGTGLGLAMVYGMLERHGGSLEIDSEPGRGTTVRLIFPSTAQPVALSPPVRSTLQPLRLLIIDDDRVLLKSLRETLEADGCIVRSADHGQAGIDMFASARQRGEVCDAVITDLGMPRVNGYGVAAAIKAMSPRTPVILLTGWGHKLQTEKRPEHIDRILGKPPRLVELRTVLTELTQQPAPAALPVLRQRVL
jgi:CheY-like chemotaxis protein